jgi:AhpD family alkylhydroperoxidase
MTELINYAELAPDVVEVLLGSQPLLDRCPLERDLRALVAIRASQINGCGPCLAMHLREAETLGISKDRIVGLDAWHEAHWYSDRERAALEWTEALTRLSERRPPEALLARMREHFDDKELVYLTLAVTQINTFNRFNVGLRIPSELGVRAYEMRQRA